MRGNHHLWRRHNWGGRHGWEEQRSQFWWHEQHQWQYTDWSWRRIRNERQFGHSSLWICLCCLWASKGTHWRESLNTDCSLRTCNLCILHSLLWILAPHNLLQLPLLLPLPHSPLPYMYVAKRVVSSSQNKGSFFNDMVLICVNWIPTGTMACSIQISSHWIWLGYVQVEFDFIQEAVLRSKWSYCLSWNNFSVVLGPTESHSCKSYSYLIFLNLCKYTP